MRIVGLACVWVGGESDVTGTLRCSEEYDATERRRVG